MIGKSSAITTNKIWAGTWTRSKAMRENVTHILSLGETMLNQGRKQDQAPVPLSIFRSNSKFYENSKHSSVTYSRPITTTFCTRHDSVTVVTCAKYRCDRSSIFETRGAFWIFIEFRIRSKYAYWDGRLVVQLIILVIIINSMDRHIFVVEL